MHSSFLVVLGLLALAIPQNSVSDNAERPPEVQQLIASLPECSRLRRDLERGRYSDEPEMPYMQAMRQQGVQRAYIEFKGNWHHNHAENIQIVRRIYYKQLEGPDAQISDSGVLNQIETSGLRQLIDQAAVERSKKAQLFRFRCGQDPIGILKSIGWEIGGSKIFGWQELFSSRYLPSSNFVETAGRRADVEHAASIGDVIDLSKILRQGKHSQTELNMALNFAVMSSWDNTAAIEMLIKAGADVNAKFGDDSTPLMHTYECSCNIPVLLAHGARVEDQDKWGRTALDLARRGHDEVRIRFLQGQTLDLSRP
jgi:hypothetical protein